MENFKDKQFDLKAIQNKFNISQKDIDNSVVSEEELRKIYDHYKSTMLPELDKYKSEILKILTEDLTGRIHSIRGRIKDPDHLVEKIIRNTKSKPKKYKSINVDNYYKIITDLIGFRVIILDKRDWREIHKSLLEVFHGKADRYVNNPDGIVDTYDKYEVKSAKLSDRITTCFHAEKPNVYITSEDDRNEYIDKDLKVDNSKTHYRSIHYIIRYGVVYFEIQVRTIFEEGWLEFDHRITYPYDMTNRKKKRYVSMLNSLATAADQLISFYEDIDFSVDSNNKENKDESIVDESVNVVNEDKDIEAILVDAF